MKTKESSVIYRKIDELSLTELDRAEAIGALQAADRMADSIYWIFDKIDRVAGWLAPRPHLKHQ